MTNDELQDLINAHWEWTKGLLNHVSLDLDDDQTIQLIGFVYRTAFEHGFKHGVEDVAGDDYAVEFAKKWAFSPGQVRQVLVSEEDESLPRK